MLDLADREVGSTVGKLGRWWRRAMPITVILSPLWGFNILMKKVVVVMALQSENLVSFTPPPLKGALTADLW